jgi:hypothetical protein
MTLIPNAANIATDADGGFAMSAGKLRGALRCLFATDWSERWMIVVNDHAVGTLTRDAGGMSLTWFEQLDNGVPELTAHPDTSLSELHQEIARKLDIMPRRIAFLPIGE